MLTPEQFEHFRTLLVRERAAVELRMKERAARMQAAPGLGELADVADEASILAQREQASIENNLDSDLLVKIDRALERIREGTYGTSEVSGRPIPVERLEAVPWATALVGERPPGEP